MYLDMAAKSYPLSIVAVPTEVAALNISPCGAKAAFISVINVM